MHTIVKFFISLLFALVVGILTVPSRKTISIALVDAAAPAADASAVGCTTLMSYGTFRVDASFGDS